MEPVEKATRINHLRAAMRMRGHSIASWARSRAYKPITVKQVIYRHLFEKEPTYKGMKTHEIILALRHDFPEIFDLRLAEVANGN